MGVAARQAVNAASGWHELQQASEGFYWNTELQLKKYE